MRTATVHQLPLAPQNPVLSTLVEFATPSVALAVGEGIFALLIEGCDRWSASMKSAPPRGQHPGQLAAGPRPFPRAATSDSPVIANDTAMRPANLALEGTTVHRLLSSDLQAIVKTWCATNAGGRDD